MATHPFSVTPNPGLTAKFKQLQAKVAANRPQDDLEIIRKAYEFSLKHHEGQSRASGEPYLIHPLEVSLVLADMKLDSTAIAAGLLHDAIEDTDAKTSTVSDPPDLKGTTGAVGAGLRAGLGAAGAFARAAVPIRPVRMV